MTDAIRYPGLRDAIPFWVAVLLVPLLWVSATLGGWWLLVLPVVGWFLSTLIDLALGHDRTELDPDTDENALGWYYIWVWAWVPVQATAIFGTLAYVTSRGHLSALEAFGLFFGVGVITGSIGINYSHELMHRRSKRDRWLADALLAMVFYSHFRSEHLLVHHTHVGTPRDAISAPYDRGFHRHFLHVLPACLKSAWHAEAERLRKAGRPAWDRRNPFWRYGALQLFVAGLALLIGGWIGLALVLWQGFVAVWQLELTNYVEHYGLSRRRLDNGRYEPVATHHSWNATHTFTNWLLINLQRHSDHHVQPARPYPLLKAHSSAVAPELPFGYPLMTAIAMVPPLWRRLMNPRVRKWRKQFYPDVADWTRNAA